MKRCSEGWVLKYHRPRFSRTILAVFDLPRVTCLLPHGTNQPIESQALSSFFVAAVHIPSPRVCNFDGRTRLPKGLLSMAGKTPLLCMRFRIGPPGLAKITCIYCDLSTELAPALSERVSIRGDMKMWPTSLSLAEPLHPLWLSFNAGLRGYEEL